MRAGRGRAAVSDCDGDSMKSGRILLPAKAGMFTVRLHSSEDTAIEKLLLYQQMQVIRTMQRRKAGRMIIMKKIRMFAAIACAAAVMTGCAKTPEQAIVREKSGQSLENYKEAENTEQVSIAPSEVNMPAGQEHAASVGLENSGTGRQNALAARLQAPAVYEADIQSEDGTFVLNCNAEVQVPAVDNVSVYRVGQMEFSQEWIDRVTDTFFGDAPIYNGYTYDIMTKAEVLEKLNQLKAWKAEGNTDPYGYIAAARESGVDNPEEFYDLQSDIDAREQEYAQAPETADRTEAAPGLGGGLSMTDEGEDPSVNNFIGMVEMEGKLYRYQLKSYVSMPMIIDITNYSKRQQKSDILNWYETDFSAAEEEASLNGEETYLTRAGMTREKAQEMAGISPQEAQKEADAYMEKLGLLGDFSAKNVELSLCSSVGDTPENELRYLDAGYQVHYTRDINGFPVTDEEDDGGGLESMESTLEPWSYERVEIIINKDGLQKVMIRNLYEVQEKQVENVEMMSFPEAASIFESMLQIKNSDMTYSKGIRFDIDKVTLGYMRVYDPGADNTTGLLVPVWDFFGRSEEKADYNGEEHVSVISRPTYSRLTINAADGTVIDRDLGY